MDIQSILITKKYTTLKDCKKWLKENKFKITKPHITKDYYRFRQQNPKKYKHFKYKRINKNICFILAKK